MTTARAVNLAHVGAGHARDWNQSPWEMGQPPHPRTGLAQKNEAPPFTPDDRPLDLTVIRQTEESV